jgi:hypothetical protein
VPAEIEVAALTEGQQDRIHGSIFVLFAGEEETALRIPVRGWVRDTNAPPHMEVFYAQSERGGIALCRWWRKIASHLGASERACVEWLPVEDVANYKRLREIQRRFVGARPAEVVAALDDGLFMLHGSTEVRAGLIGLLNLDSRESTDRHWQRYADPADGQTALANLGIEPVTNAGSGSRLEAWLFYFSNCRKCQDARKAVEDLRDVLGGRISVGVFDATRNPQAIAVAYATLSQYSDLPSTVPSAVAFFGDVLLLGTDEITAYSQKTALAQLARGGGHLHIPRPQYVPPLYDHAHSLGVLPVVLAALADGVNPCAFAAIVLLISVLTAGVLPEERSESRTRILLGGGAFCLGTFATYFAAGIALFEGVYARGSLRWVEAVVFWLIWLSALVGGILSA